MSRYNPDDPKQLSNWFNPHSVKHCKALREVVNTGIWPAWLLLLIEKNKIIVNDHWRSLIYSKIVIEWLKEKLNIEE